jgi:hypothetical protein
LKESQVRIRTCIAAVVALGATAAILADTAMDVALTTDVLVFAGQPDVPRNVTVKGNDANVAGNVTIYGTDAEGNAINEVIALAGAASSSATRRSRRSPRSRCRICGREHRAGPRRHRRQARPAGPPDPQQVIAAFLANVREAVAPTVTVHAANLESNTVTLNSALNGTAVIVDLYETQ